MSLRDRLAARELTIGSWLSFGYTPVAEIMAKAGFDWLVVDMEHTAIDAWDCFQLIQIIELAGSVPLVRVGANDELLIKRALDAGAHGVVVPMVNTAEEAERAVASARYAPAGRRGAGLGRAHDYGVGFQRYWDWAIEHVVVIAQIEHITAVENIDAILAVDGIDAFIVGPYDLSCSLGCSGDFEAPPFMAAMERIREAVLSGPKPAGFHVVHTSANALETRVAEGYRFIAYGDDMVFLAEKVEEASRHLQAVPGRGPSPRPAASGGGSTP